MTTEMKCVDIDVCDLNEAELDQVVGGATVQQVWRAFLTGAATGYGGEVCIGDTCASPKSTVTF